MTNIRFEPSHINPFLGAQPEAVGFFDRLGYTRGPIGFVAAQR